MTAVPFCNAFMHAVPVSSGWSTGSFFSPLPLSFYNLPGFFTSFSLSFLIDNNNRFEFYVGGSKIYCFGGHNKCSESDQLGAVYDRFALEAWIGEIELETVKTYISTAWPWWISKPNILIEYLNFIAVISVIITAYYCFKDIFRDILEIFVLTYLRLHYLRRYIWSIIAVRKFDCLIL